MLGVSTKESLVCYEFVSVRLNGFRTLLVQSKFEVLTLLQGVNQEEVNTVLGIIAH
jgi:hypothetical protein